MNIFLHKRVTDSKVRSSREETEGEDVQSKIAVFDWCWLKIYFRLHPTAIQDAVDSNVRSSWEATEGRMFNRRLLCLADVGWKFIFKDQLATIKEAIGLERSQQLRGDRGEDVQSKIAVFDRCWLKIYFQRPTSGKDRGLRSKQHSTPKTSRPKRHRLTESL